MPDDFLIARNPEEDSTLPYLLRIPLGPDGIVVKARDTWPRTAKVYCHRAAEWPDDAEIIDRIPVQSINRRGPSIDLVLDRAREKRSQFVLTRARGREMIFWQSRQTVKQARPNVVVPTARAHGQVLDVVVDSSERYAYKFSSQQAATTVERLPAGDYAVRDDTGSFVAAVERKSFADYSSSLMSGRLNYVMAELAALYRGAVVVEAPYSKVFKHEYARGATLPEATAEAQIRFPSVPIMFCDNRKLAEEWTYRWLGAALHERRQEHGTTDVEATFASAPTAIADAPGVPVKPAEIRAWARSVGLKVPDKGRIPADVRAAFEARRT